MDSLLSLVLRCPEEGGGSEQFVLWPGMQQSSDQTPSSPLFIWLTCGACHEHLLHGLPSLLRRRP